MRIRHKRWSYLSRQRASERFWKPVYEQAGVITELIHSGEMSLYDFLADPDTYVDPQLFGNRMNSPPFQRALIRELRRAFPGMVA